jgi:septum formation protein
VAGIPYEVAPASDAERTLVAHRVSLPHEAAPYALELAVAKAETVAGGMPDRLVLGADTVVVLAGEILEKPTSAADAIRILTLLAGRQHRVITALALLDGRSGKRWTGWEETNVEFLPLSRDAIARYVDTGEPLDKAGAYGIQGYGSLMVRRLEGCYFNVMGLPLALLGEALRTVLTDGVTGTTGGN